MKLTKIALGVALAAGTVSAHAAYNLWFPHVVHSGVVTTVATVLDPAGDAGNSLHWIYTNKTLLEGMTYLDFNKELCSETNGPRSFSSFDIQSVDLGGVLSTNDKGVLFNDPGQKNPWASDKPYTFAKLAMEGVNGAIGNRGYLVVQATGGATKLEGYALVFDYTTGAAWGYTAEELVATSHTHKVGGWGMHIMPPDEVISRLLITPVAAAVNDMLPGGAAHGKAMAYVAPVAVKYPDATGYDVHIFDRDEGPTSGFLEEVVACVGSVDAYQDLLPPSTQKMAPDGGWMKVATTNAPVKGTAPAPGGVAVPGAVVYQNDFGGSGVTPKGTLNGKAFPGMWNNLTILQ